MKIWRPYTQMEDAPLCQKVIKTQGAHLYLDNGQKLLDGIASWWVITHGHCHSGISSAISDQAHMVDQVVFANFSHEKSKQLVESLT
ncbi:MAG: aminotransferase class III-fold pyridoxal phosphate-dependent enzyme, partial [Bdellovibrionales bacterium]|nr:aminotransferase class III-fold pyridoxal phosphate-dependent enzyme [Bdellovibrionales bacterium]